MKNSYDIIIVGAGASGLMCAAHLKKKYKTLVLDSNEKPARKIKISGGGKCNLTNRYVSCENFTPFSPLLESTLQRFGKEWLLGYFKARGLELRLKEGRFYFCSHSSQQVIDILLEATKHVDFAMGQRLVSLTKEKDGFILQSTKGSYRAARVLIASGGVSFPNIGASDIALQVAKSMGIEYEPFKPALVGMTLQKEQFWMKELSGISVDVCIGVEKKEICGSMLFAHRGISGPAVLNCSLYWKKGKVRVDFLPHAKLDALLAQGKKRFISSSLPLPKRFVKAFLAHVGVADKECAKVTQEEYAKLQSLHAYEFAPAGNFGFSKAEVSLGGVKTEELKESFESKKVQGLYFIGEAVNVTGELGGYNFQWAFGSGAACASSLNQTL